MEAKRKKQSTLAKLSAWVFNLLKKSFIGKFFTSYDSANERFAKKSSKQRHSPRKKSFERVLENNFFARIIPKIFESLLRVATRSYAIVFFVMSTIVFCLYFLNGRTILAEIYVSTSSFIAASLMMVISFAFLFTSKTLAQTLISNKLINLIAFKFFGIYDDTVHEMAKEKKITATTVSFAIGIAFGILSYLVSPIFVISAILMLVFAYLIFRTPEIGVVLVLVSLPFAEPMATKVMIVYILLPYLVKVILRKRILTFEYHDAWAVAFVVVMTICSIDYQNVYASLVIAINNLSIFIAYFVVSNLIRSSDWFRKCITAMTVAGLIVAAIAILQMILNILSIYLGDIVSFLNFDLEINSTFNDNNILAQFLVVTIPFALVHMFSQKREIKKIVDLLITGTLIIALLLTGSVSSLFGILVGIMLLLVIYNRNFIYLAMVTIGSSIGAFLLIKENAQVRELAKDIGILDNLDPTAKIAEIGSGIKEFLSLPTIFGKGAGSNAPGIENFALQLGIEYGIFTIIAFILFAVVFARLVFSYCATTNSKNRKIYSSVGLCALVALFTAGLFLDVWADDKIMILSVLCVALSFAFIKIQKRKAPEEAGKTDFLAATVDIEIEDTEDHSYTARKYLRAPKNLKIQRPRKKAEVPSYENELIHVEDPEIEDDDIEDENRV